MDRLSHRGLAYYQFGALRGAGVNHGIFTRLGGVSEGSWASLNMSRSTGDTAEPVRENRRRALDALGLRQEHSLTSWLVHGNDVRVVGHDDLGHDDVHADAMITQARGLALTLRFADCVPVLFHDPARGAIGIAHAGWKGIVNGALPATVRAMQQAYGSRPAELVAGIGPCIGPDKFEVGEDVAALIQAAVSASVVSRQPGLRIDLWAAARAQLEQAGVGHVEVAGICTASNTHEWFSHRAERAKTGRFGAIIVLA
jgi:YfiH family protein